MQITLWDLGVNWYYELIIFSHFQCRLEFGDCLWIFSTVERVHSLSFQLFKFIYIIRLHWMRESERKFDDDVWRVVISKTNNAAVRILHVSVLDTYSSSDGIKISQLFNCLYFLIRFTWLYIHNGIISLFLSSTTTSKLPKLHGLMMVLVHRIVSFCIVSGNN